MEHRAYLEWKREIVRRSFLLHGIDAPVEPVVATSPGGRRRAIFSAINFGAGSCSASTAAARGRSSRSRNARCFPATSSAICRSSAKSRRAPSGRASRRAWWCLPPTASTSPFPAAAGSTAAALETLGRFGREQAIARLTVDGAEVFVNRRPEIADGDATLLPPPGGFVQASATAETAMAEAMLAHVGAATPVADLFCGVGTFTLRLARQSAVTAVEGDAALLAALDLSARHATGLKPVNTMRRDLFANPLAPAELDRFAAVVFDPPRRRRQGAGRGDSSNRTCRRWSAVSCNPATLARDARILIDGGYRLTRVLPVDQFLWSAEIEAVAAFAALGCRGSRSLRWRCRTRRGRHSGARGWRAGGST